MIASMMSRCSFAICAVALSLPIAVSQPASAAQSTFQKPTWNGKRLDWCFTWAKNCGEPVAKAYCLAAGYQTATRFTQEPARPTQLIAQRRVCNESFCQGFKSITCFTSAATPGPRREGPRMID